MILTERFHPLNAEDANQQHFTPPNIASNNAPKAGAIFIANSTIHRPTENEVKLVGGVRRTRNDAIDGATKRHGKLGAADVVNEHAVGLETSTSTFEAKSVIDAAELDSAETGISASYFPFDEGIEIMTPEKHSDKPLDLTFGEKCRKEMTAMKKTIKTIHISTPPTTISSRKSETSTVPDLRRFAPEW